MIIAYLKKNNAIINVNIQISKRYGRQRTGESVVLPISYYYDVPAVLAKFDDCVEVVHHLQYNA